LSRTELWGKFHHISKSKFGVLGTSQILKGPPIVSFVLHLGSELLLTLWNSRKEEGTEWNIAEAKKKQNQKKKKGLFL
jgi:hypothetical protein